jgi:predicted ester cyclase
VVFTEFPDIYAEIEHMVTENDLIVTLLNFVWTHRGEFRDMLPTNEPVNIRSADLHRKNLSHK